MQCVSIRLMSLIFVLTSMVSCPAGSRMSYGVEPQAPPQAAASLPGTARLSKAEKRWARFDSATFRTRLESPKENVRIRAVREIARVFPDHPEVPRLFINAVNKSLGKEKESVSGSTLAMIEALGQVQGADARDALLDLLERETAGDRASPLSLALLQSLKNFRDPVVDTKVLPLLSAADFRHVMLAVDLLSRHQSAEAFEPIKSLVDHDAYSQRYGFRCCMFEGIASYPDVRAVDFLIQRLPQLDGQLRFAVASHLTRTSGQPFGGNAAAWTAWWSTSRSLFQVPDQLMPAPAFLVWHRPVPQFFGQNIYASRFVFLIDISSTMTEMANLLETRLDVAKRELKGAITQLTDDVFFNIVAFDVQLRPWTSGLVQATAQNKRGAIRAVDQLANGGGTNIFDSLEAALMLSDHPNSDLEAVFLLSDGLPTAGRIREEDLIVEVISSENLFRRVSINTIAVGRHSGMMQNLATLNRGAYRITR